MLKVFLYLPNNDELVRYRNMKDEENVEFTCLSILTKLLPNDKLLKELLTDNSLITLFLMPVEDCVHHNYHLQEK